MIKSLFSSATAKDTSFLFFGSMISNLAGFILLALLARTISQNDLGLFTTALTLSQLLADMFEFGINPATLTFLSQGKSHQQTIQISFWLKIILVIVVVLGSLFLAGPIANFIFRNQEMEKFVQVSGLGAGFLMLIAWCQNIFQAERKFFLASVINTSTNIFRLLIVILALVLGITSGLSIFFLFQIVLILSLSFFVNNLKRDLIPLKFNSSDAKPILSFGLPIGLGFSIAALYTRLDQILIFNIAGEREAAIYGIASRLMLIVIYAVAAFSSVTIVRFASLEQKDFKSYFKKTWMVILALISTILIGIILTPILVPIIFGPTYIPSVVPLQILALGIIFFICSIPLSNVILYRYKKPSFSLFLSVISLILAYFLLELFIPQYQSRGAALAMMIVYFVQFVLAAAYYLKIKHD